MQGVAFERDDTGNQELLLRITRRDLDELISTLRKAEELSESLRQQSHDFRIHRLRLACMKKESLEATPSTLPPTDPPPPPLPTDPPIETRKTARYIEASDLNRFLPSKKPRG